VAPSIPPAQTVPSHAGTWVPAGYFDAASGLPLRPAAREALITALEHGFADPSRQYHSARRTRQLLDQARETVAGVLGARPDEISFTSSGTQAAHLGIQGLALGRARVGTGILVSAVEHSSVLHSAYALAGDAVQELPVDASGAVITSALADCLAASNVSGQGFAFAAVQSANHEVGTRQPLPKIAELLRQAGVPLMVDAAQSVGREAVPADWDVLTASAHKWGGPSGVGVLAVRSGVRWRSPLPADAHEGARVPGFVAVPAIFAAAVALQEAEAERVTATERLHALTARLRERLVAQIPHAVALGDPDDRLPHIVTLSIPYVAGEALLADLDRAGFAVSSGSSCVADSLVPSHVLVAMGALTHGNLRVSLPPDVTDRDVDRFISVLPPIVASAREALGAQDL
jgi:cysteine desulfurase